MMWSLFLVHLLLPLPALGWWCETSARTGCRGHPRHFVLDRSPNDMFEVFATAPVAPSHQVLAVDWDQDGDLDLITLDNLNHRLNLFEQGDDNSFVKKEPSPFSDLGAQVILPAVVDVNGDSIPDVVAATPKEVRYFKRYGDDDLLMEETGSGNPFRSITGMLTAGHLAIADWDNDGHMDLLITDWVLPMRHFRESGGAFHLQTASPFVQMQNHSLFRKPLFVDWNNDGRMDLLLVEQPLRRGRWGSMFSELTGGTLPLPTGNAGCEVLIFLQDDAGNFYENSEPKGVLENQDCRYMNWLFFDVDGDEDLDVMLATRSSLGVGQAWHLYENTGGSNFSLSSRNEKQTTSSFPLSKIKLPEMDPLQAEPWDFYCPSLLDFDLDGDLDLVLLSATPVQADDVVPRFFQQNADHSVSELTGPPNSSCPFNWNFPVSSTDFDGDGLVDLVGMTGFFMTGFFAYIEVLVCLQGPDGYVPMDQQTNPFYPSIDSNGTRHACTWDMYRFAFLDWDGDGDVDQLCMNSTGAIKTTLLLVEQVANGTLSPRPLPLPPANDFVASDFDGDGDIDLILLIEGFEGWKYYERTEDGNLLELLEDENPFHRSVLVSHSAAFWSHRSCSTLGDWNNDGAVDFVVVDPMKVSLLWNKPLPKFVEYDREQNPFSEIRIQEPMVADWNLVDVDGDGDLDFVLSEALIYIPDTLKHKYFQQNEEGDLIKVEGVANPLRSAPFSVFGGEAGENVVVSSYHMAADVDGDGDLDIVHQTPEGLHYAEQRNGSFVIWKGKDNPFWPGLLAARREDARYDCWTLVDFDGDGDLDLVKSKPSNPENPLVFRELLYYEQASPRWTSQRSNISFHRRYGKDNPFWSVNLLAMDPGPLCPEVVDMDGDGDLDLVLVNGEHDRRLLIYFEQENGIFKRAKQSLFADIFSIKNSIYGSMRFQFADFNGDGMMDFVISAGPTLQYYTKGVCFSPSACHTSATCSKKTKGKATCKCLSGSDSPECRLCTDYHTQQDSMCRSCPGFGSVSGTCTFRGVCDDDVDARNRQAEQNVSGFAQAAATGTGLCTCSEHFHGENCELGECPPGHRLERNARVTQATDKYPHWEACVPCESGRYKSSYGNEDCEVCKQGLVPDADRRSCVECQAGHEPTNFSICAPCRAGYVASPGDPRCTPCRAGTAPNPDNSTCVRCGDGKVARFAFSPKCSQCSAGSVPDASRTNCLKCSGQYYAYEGDETCRTCSLPFMVLWVENWCTLLYFFLFLLLFLIFALLLASVFGRFRLMCFKSRLKQMVEDKRWRELYATRTSRLEYGIWHAAADAALTGQKEDVKSRSMQLGISLRYVFNELQATYEDRADQVEWRVDTFGPATRSGFLVRIRNMEENVPDTDAAWHALQICDYTKDPNFHQVASLLAYGPLALGKGQWCPRDGEIDCSIVDALQATGRSGPATWFLSWVWEYKFSTVSQALSRWWQKHQMVSGASDDIFIWWCVMVNNQFRMLEQGHTAAATNLFDVFGRQLAGIGKMLMCLDKMKEGNYTTRIWCIFEVFVACQRSIPTTVILPDLEGLDNIETLKELTKQCRVDAERAEASVPQDAIDIKKRIMDDHGSFEFVNQTVEKELCWEVIKFMEEQEATQATQATPATHVAAQGEAAKTGSGSSTDQPGSTQLSEASDKFLTEKGPSLERCHIQ